MRMGRSFFSSSLIGTPRRGSAFFPVSINHFRMQTSFPVSQNDLGRDARKKEVHLKYLQNALACHHRDFFQASLAHLDRCEKRKKLSVQNVFVCRVRLSSFTMCLNRFVHLFSDFVTPSVKKRPLGAILRGP